MLTKYREFSPSLKREVREICGHACAFCGAYEALEIHHVVPRGMGGDKSKNEQSNLILLCARCHRRIESKAVRIIAWNPSAQPSSEQLQIEQKVPAGGYAEVPQATLYWYRTRPFITEAMRREGADLA